MSEQKNLWAPWRGDYVGTPEAEREPGCIFCLAREGAKDPKQLVVAQGERCFLIMNRFPYSTGHLMVVPNEHIAELEELDAGTWSEMLVLARAAKRALTALYGPDGFNMGLNLGSAAGAGIAQHLHLHLVPRWEGDVNFMPVLADVRVQPQHMDEVYADLTREIAAILK
jgi:ATP adenylyltransferase